MSGNVMKREAQFRRYRPKRWHPEFDLIVYASFAGESNTDIARKFGYTPQHISNILCSEHAEKIRETLREKISDEGDKSIAARMKVTSDKAVERMEKFMNNDELFEKSPFAFIDRAMRAIQITGASKEDNSKIVINNQTNNIGTAAMDRIADALLASNEVKLLHQGLDPSKQIKLEETKKISVD